MGRSKWKGPYLDLNQNNIKVLTTRVKKKQPNLIITSRNSEITPKSIGQTFKVYNGKVYSEISVNKDMIGHKFGEFSFTRGKFHFKKKKLKK